MIVHNTVFTNKIFFPGTSSTIVVLSFTVRNGIVEVAGGMQHRLVLAVQPGTVQCSTSSACSDWVCKDGTDCHRHDHADQHDRNDDAECRVAVIVVRFCKQHQQQQPSEIAVWLGGWVDIAFADIDISIFMTRNIDINILYCSAFSPTSTFHYRQ